MKEDTVFLSLGGKEDGVMQEFMIFKENDLVHAPKNWNCIEAATLPCAALTAWRTIVTEGKIDKDSIVLAQGLGGVSIFAIQIAKLFNAKVIATTSSEERVIKAKEIGADYVINYARENFVEKVREITNGEGVDVVFDSIGQKSFYESLRCLKKYGLMVSFGNSSGKLPSFDLGLLNGHLFITRPTLWAYTSSQKELEISSQELISLIISKKIKIPIYNKLPLAEAVNVHKNLESRKTFGSTILIP